MRIIEIAQFEQQREGRPKTKWTEHRGLWDLTNDPTFLSLEFWREKGGWCWKRIWNNGWKCPILGKRNFKKWSESQSWFKKYSKIQEVLQEIHAPNTIILLKTTKKEKIVKSRREKWQFFCREKQLEWQWISHQKPQSPEWRETIFLELSTQDSTQSENILQEWRGNQDNLRQRKTKRICDWQSYAKRVTERTSWNRRNEWKKGI